MKTENLIYIKVMTGKFYMFQNVCIVKIIKITIIWKELQGYQVNADDITVVNKSLI